MTREAIIENTVRVMITLPQEQIEEVADFASFIQVKNEKNLISRGIQNLVEQSKTFDFLNDEEDLYGLKDINTTADA